MECAEAGCTNTAAFELHVPWADNRFVCPAHARVAARQDGVVADPVETAEDELPDGAADQ